MEKDVLHQIFRELNSWIDQENTRLRSEGLFPYQKCEAKIFGQMSLLVNEKVSAVLKLVGTGDLDALLKMDYPIKRKLVELLKRGGLKYDELSNEVWLPKDAHFIPLFSFNHVTVSLLDSESALVSKAVKAREKNKILIRDAIASDKFPTLADRIEANGGDLNFFLE